MRLLKKCLAVGFIFLLVSTLTNTTRAQLADSPWPKLRQNIQNTSMSHYAGPDEVSILWDYKLDHPISGIPTIGPSETIYITSDWELHALSTSGSLKWKKDRWESSSAVPAISQDTTIYLSPVNGPFTALKSDGNSKWHYESNWPLVYGQAGPSSATIDQYGTIYFGWYDTTGTRNTAVYALNPNGNLKWVTDTKELIDNHNSITIDYNSNLYIAEDTLVQAIDSSGSTKWSYNTKGEIRSPVTVGNDGTIYIGTAIDSTGKLYALTSSGEEKWVKSLSDPVTASVALYEGNQIYVETGSVIRSFELSGDIQWQFDADGSIQGISVDNEGTSYFGTDSNSLYAINKEGNTTWKFNSQSKINFSTPPVIGKDNMLYIGSADSSLYAIGQSDSSSVDVPLRDDLPNKVSLKQNYPNPFNPTTTIKYSLPEATEVKLTVYNLLGQQVAELVDTRKQTGTYTVTFDAGQLSSGVYIYKLQTESFSKSRKMLLLK